MQLKVCILTYSSYCFQKQCNYNAPKYIKIYRNICCQKNVTVAIKNTYIHTYIHTW